MIVCRCAEPLDRDIRSKIALFANLPVDNIISGRDADSIYKVPLYFRAEGVDDQVLAHFGVDVEDKPDLSDWEAMARRRDHATETVRIAMAGKYTQLADAYLSVIEALEHAGTYHGVRAEVQWV